jgi:hypothetical protein
MNNTLSTCFRLAGGTAEDIVEDGMVDRREDEMKERQNSSTALTSRATGRNNGEAQRSRRSAHVRMESSPHQMCKMRDAPAVVSLALLRCYFETRQAESDSEG